MKPELLVAQTDSEKDSFSIHVTKEKMDESEVVDPDNLNYIFSDDDSLGSRFFGWGIIHHLIKLGNQALILIPKNRSVQLPGGQDEGE